MMANSLFDQLRKTGLVSDQQAKQAQKAKGKTQFLQTKQNQVPQNTAAIACAITAQAQEKAEYARRLNRERQQQQAGKATQAEVRQIIESNRISGFEGTVPYHFADGAQVKTLNVNPQTHQRLVACRIRIARVAGGFALIPADAAVKLMQRDADVLIPALETNAALSQEDAAYYAQFAVPDDLMW